MKQAVLGKNKFISTNQSFSSTTKISGAVWVSDIFLNDTENFLNSFRICQKFVIFAVCRQAVRGIVLTTVAESKKLEYDEEIIIDSHLRGGVIEFSSDGTRLYGVMETGERRTVEGLAENGVGGARKDCGQG
ncbi:MAG: hypothetical protein II509_01065 [Prevotella sp.]|nr:hypothetical protein [Prevotella sp.]